MFSRSSPTLARHIRFWMQGPPLLLSQHLPVRCWIFGFDLFCIFILRLLSLMSVEGWSYCSSPIYIFFPSYVGVFICLCLNISFFLPFYVLLILAVPSQLSEQCTPTCASTAGQVISNIVKAQGRRNKGDLMGTGTNLAIFCLPLLSEKWFLMTQSQGFWLTTSFEGPRLSVKGSK